MAATTQHSIIQQMANGMPHGLGLLTTVASLPPKYRSRYLSIKTKCETPLDLSVKPLSPQIVSDVPIATNFTEVYTEQEAGEDTRTSSDAQTRPVEADSAIGSATAMAAQTVTPPLTPTKRKYTPHELADDLSEDIQSMVESVCQQHETYTNPQKVPRTELKENAESEGTPTKPIKPTDTAPRTAKSQPPATKPVRSKATRKLKFDEETSSPVSGTIIRPLEDITDGTVQYSNGDIDPKYNIVEVTEEIKAELAAIKNVIGDYICKLCRIKFDDAFGLARHRCACIVLLEYRCPECGKQFNCPANLASHRRWHKPKKEGGSGGAAAGKKENRSTAAAPAKAASTLPPASKKIEEPTYTCNECGKKFKRPAYLRKHQLTHTTRSKPAGKLVDASHVMEERAPTVAGSYQSYASSSASSMHSYGGTQDEVVHVRGNSYDYDMESMSDCSTSSAGYGRLQIVESGLTEEENIAAAALTNLRNCASVIQHTTLAH